MQNHSFTKRTGIEDLQPYGQQERKCWTPPASYQRVPVSSQTGIRNIQIRNSIGGGEVACGERLRQPCAKHHRPDGRSDFSRNRCRNIQSSSATVVPVIIILFWPLIVLAHALAKMAKSGYKSGFAPTARTSATHNEVSYTCTREFDRRSCRGVAFGPRGEISWRSCLSAF